MAGAKISVSRRGVARHSESPGRGNCTVGRRTSTAACFLSLYRRSLLRTALGTWLQGYRLPIFFNVTSHSCRMYLRRTFCWWRTRAAMHAESRIHEERAAMRAQVVATCGAIAAARHRTLLPLTFPLWWRQAPFRRVRSINLLRSVLYTSRSA